MAPGPEHNPVAREHSRGPSFPTVFDYLRGRSSSNANPEQLPLLGRPAAEPSPDPFAPSSLSPFPEIQSHEMVLCETLIASAQAVARIPTPRRAPASVARTEAIFIAHCFVDSPNANAGGRTVLEDMGLKDEPVILALGPGMWHNTRLSVDGGSQTTPRSAYALTGEQPTSSSPIVVPASRAFAHSTRWTCVKYLDRPLSITFSHTKGSQSYHDHRSANGSLWIVKLLRGGHPVKRDGKDVGSYVLFTDDRRSHLLARNRIIRDGRTFAEPFRYDSQWDALVHQLLCNIDAYGLDDGGWHVTKETRRGDLGGAITVLKVRGARARTSFEHLVLHGSPLNTIDYGLPYSNNSDQRLLIISWFTNPTKAHYEYLERHTASRVGLPSEVTSTHWRISFPEAHDQRDWAHRQLEVEFTP